MLAIFIALTALLSGLGTLNVQATTMPAISTPDVQYRTHVQNVGWQSYRKNGETSGTSGRSLRLEGIDIRVNGRSGGIEYQTHVQNVGWQDWKKNGQMSGTSGKSLRLEGIKIRLTGEIAKYYDVYYRTHVQSIGWQDWKVNGGMSGTSGRSLRLEAIQIKLEPKPASSSADLITYSTHIQNYGWQQTAGEGEVSGSWGKSLRLEGIKINVADSLKSQVEYTTHVQNIGWQNYVTNGQVSGTQGKGLRLEGIKIRWKKGAPAAKDYDIVYSTHIEGIGWQNWVKNDALSGTTGQGKRLEAIQIKLVKRIAVTGVIATIDKSILHTGEVAQVTTKVIPLEATNKAVTYSSDNTKVAIIDGNGKVTAKGVGDAIITVKTVDGGKTASLRVTVKPVSVTGVTVKIDKSRIRVGEVAQLTPTVLPNNATNKAVTYSSSNTNVAVVDSKGKVTPKSAGEVNLTVKTADGGKTAVVKLTVAAYRTYNESVSELYNKHKIIFKADDASKVNPNLLSNNVDAVNKFYSENPQFKKLDVTKLDEVRVTKLPYGVAGQVTTQYYVSNHKIVSMKMELSSDYYNTAVGNEGDEWEFGINHVFVHEYGHVNQRLMEDKIRQGGVDFRMLKQVLNNKANAKITDAKSMVDWWSKNINLIAQNITPYGANLSYGTDSNGSIKEAYPTEPFAELFAESFTQNNPRVWSKEFKRLLTAYMTEISRSNNLEREENPADDEIVTEVWQIKE